MANMRTRTHCPPKTPAKPTVLKPLFLGKKRVHLLCPVPWNNVYRMYGRQSIFRVKNLLFLYSLGLWHLWQ